MTADEFLALGETDRRLELIDGVVVVSPSPIPLHQKIARVLMRAVEDTLAPGSELFHETDVVLARRLVYCPDFVVYGPGRWRTVPQRLDIPPDLVVEVLSPHNRRKDLLTKRQDYEAYGVGEYWIIDTADMSALLLRRDGPGFTEFRVTNGEFKCAALPGVTVNWDKLVGVFR